MGPDEEGRKCHEKMLHELEASHCNIIIISSSSPVVGECLCTCWQPVPGVVLLHPRYFNYLAGLCEHALTLIKGSADHSEL